MTAEMCFQFSPRHCQWWSRRNVIWKTVLALCQQRQIIIHQLWQDATDGQ